MKIMTVMGTRPEIIRLSRIIPLLDRNCEHILVHTGQNYDERLGKIFFDELGLRQPDHQLTCAGETAMARVGEILEASEALLSGEQPDRLLVLGDTDSGLSAYAARRLGVPVYHMEAGNRCYDDGVPEEVNRRVIDHCSDMLLPYTRNSRDNLIREGIPVERIRVTGNPILEVIRHSESSIAGSGILERLGILAGKYCLATVHRAESVDRTRRLSAIFEGLDRVQRETGLPVVVSVHPRTARRMTQSGLTVDNPGVHLMLPFGFHDFVRLERDAALVLTDSGTVQEEACILGVPSVILRDVTERPETIRCGAGVLSGTEPDDIARRALAMLDRSGSWTAPDEYLVEDVSAAVLEILLEKN